jgi:hypothetical protein
MSQIAIDADSDNATTTSAGGAVVREAAVAYVTRAPRLAPPRADPRVAAAPAAPSVSAAADPLTPLRAATEAEDMLAFRRAYRAINWESVPPDQWADAVYLALRAGHHIIASDLADRGRQRFPDHALLQKMGRILAPRQPATIGGPGDPSAEADMAWFAAHSDEYWGQWVAVKDGQLLGAAATIGELMERVPDWRGATISQIFW